MLIALLSSILSDLRGMLVVLNGESTKGKTK